MKTDKKHITGKIKDYDKLNHIELRSDIENNNIYDTYLEAEGRTLCSPETFTIECHTSDDNFVAEYLYDSKTEYEYDLKILGLL